MPGMESLGKFLVSVGIFLGVLGLLLIFGHKVPFLGRLPGDISVQNDKVQFLFPLGTSLVVSALLTIILNVIARLWGK